MWGDGWRCFSDRQKKKKKKRCAALMNRFVKAQGDTQIALSGVQQKRLKEQWASGRVDEHFFDGALEEIDADLRCVCACWFGGVCSVPTNACFLCKEQIAELFFFSLVAIISGLFLKKKKIEKILLMASSLQRIIVTFWCLLLLTRYRLWLLRHHGEGLC